MSSTENTPLRAVLVGCGGMGRHQVRILHELEEYELTGVCDLIEQNARGAGQKTGATPYTDFAEALAAEQPDVAAICTDNASHARLTIMAAEADVRGVYCEKPMAVSLDEARAMVAACEERGIPLAINHQRRIGPDLVEMRRLMESGAIGEVRRICASCAGDILSDGTHAVDSVLHLVGDREVKWVLGQVHREMNEFMLERSEAQRQRGQANEPGFRFGHPVENGGMAVFQIVDGPRIELFTGDMRERRSIYQDYVVHGDTGRLWRPGDRAKPNVFIQDARGGTWDVDPEEWDFRPRPNDGDTPGIWRPVDVHRDESRNSIAEGYRRLALQIHEGRPHEMCGRNALRGFEVVMAIYESARLSKRIKLPLEQGRFPLAIMLEQGAL